MSCWRFGVLLACFMSQLCSNLTGQPQSFSAVARWLPALFFTFFIFFTGSSRTTPGGAQNHHRKPWRKMLWKTQWKFCKEPKLCLSTFSSFFSQTFFVTFFAHFFVTFFTIFCRAVFTYGVAEARPCYG